MERLTQWIDENRAIPRVDLRRCGHERCTTQLARYEDTGLTPEQIMELSESVKKLQEHFGDAITADQVIDFFVDFCIAQGDPERTEGALLLTNEAVTEYRELKERDTAQAPEPAPLGMDGMVCPACGKKALPWDRFCGECGQRFWEDEENV